MINNFNVTKLDKNNLNLTVTLGMYYNGANIIDYTSINFKTNPAGTAAAGVV